MKVLSLECIIELGDPWGGRAWGPCDVPPDPPVGMERLSADSSQLSTSLRIILVEDYSLTQGHGSFQGQPISDD